MKKITSLLLVWLLAFLVSAPALADSASTTLTTTVPEAQYTMTIPKDLTVSFGALSVTVGNFDVEAVAGFDTGKNVQVTVTHTDFAAEGVETTIPYTTSTSHHYKYVKNSCYVDGYSTVDGNTFLFKATSELKLYPTNSSGSITSGSDVDNYIDYRLNLSFSSADWGAALPGTYTSAITFTAEIVADEAA